MATSLTTHEQLSLHELIRMESMTIQQTQAMMPMIADEDLRREMTSCLQTGKAHLKTLVDLAGACPTAH